MIVIGGSLGGLKALRTALQRLPATFPLPIAAVLHRHKESNDALAGLLRQDLALQVHEVVDKERIAPAHLYLAPPDYHLLVEGHFFSLSTDPPVQYARPSIDVLFESAADALGPDAIAIVLTGANHDGATGAAAIKRRGGVVVVQDPATAECAVMPDAVLASVAVDHVLPPEEIAPLLIRLVAARLEAS